MNKAPLSTIADVIRGVSFCKDEGYTLPSEGRLPVIRAGSIQESLLLDVGQIWVPEAKVKESQKIRRDDIVMCTSSGSSSLVGKCAKAEVDFDGSFGAFCAGIRPKKDKVSASYLYHFLSSPAFRNWTSSSSGANIKNIRISELAEFEIPLPPLEEQKRIATILDKADAIRRKRQQAIQLADEFLRAVFLDMFGDIPAKMSPFELKGCRGAVSAASGKSSKAVLSDQTTEIPIYGGNGINGYATKALYDGPVIVVGRVGQQCAITHLTYGPSWITDNAIVVKIEDKKQFNPVYLSHAFKNSPIRDVVTRLDLPFVNQAMILDHPIPHPPIELQKKYADIHKKVLRTVDGLNKSADYSSKCFSSLAQKAFTGQL